MLNPTDIEKIRGELSSYALVMAIAKRAREIADDESYVERIMIEKPVSLAIEDFKSGDYKIINE